MEADLRLPVLKHPPAIPANCKSHSPTRERLLQSRKFHQTRPVSSPRDRHPTARLLCSPSDAHRVRALGDYTSFHW